MIYAVLDTNVLVSAILSRNPDSPTKRCLRAAVGGLIRPLYNDKIITEYREVLSRDKFDFGMDRVNAILRQIVVNGSDITPMASDEDFPDPTDRVFFEVALAKSEEGAKVVTGNARHYPTSPIVVTPAEFCAIVGI